MGKKLTQEEVIEQFKKTHGNKYDYSNVNYLSAHKMVSITCATHGEFKQTAHSHSSGSGCPSCKESGGERKVRLFLNKHKINYNPQHTFDECVNVMKLPFDFYLPDYNICIEYQGIQHYEPIDFFGGVVAFKSNKERDKIKREYCINNNIPLIIIKYNEDVPSILSYNLNVVNDLSLPIKLIC
jgi:hypothetical protein